MKKKNSRGRPLGYKLSDKSKKAISESKRGQKHSEETKEKISRTLMLYFRNIHPLSKEFSEEYGALLESDDEVKEWFEAMRDNFDSCSEVLTEKALNSKRLREISIELNMDMSSNPAVDSFTNNPEKMCELRKACEAKGLSFRAVTSVLGIRQDEVIIDG